MRAILQERARNNGMITLRYPMGMAGRKHQRRAKLVWQMVDYGLARWVNSTRTMARLTRDGWSKGR